MLSNKEIGQAMQIKLDFTLPEYPAFVEGIRRAPDRGYRLTEAQTKLALMNALRYVPEELHETLAPEFLEELKTRAEAIGLDWLAEICGAGAPTLADIIRELMKPGRDPRDELPAPILRTDVMELKDLKPGMELQGTARNVIDFGVFVDIGVHQDGLVHISRLPRRVKHPSELLAVGDVVTVWVVDVEEKRGRIGLTMCRP